MLLSGLKKIADMILNKFSYPVNYPGLRIETAYIKRNYPDNQIPGSIVCIGDSNTFGWNYRYQFSYPELLEKKLNVCNANVKVLNCGIGGNTISDGYERFKNDILFFNPETAVINFGLNDGMLIKLNRNNNIKKKSNLLYELNNNYYGLKVEPGSFKSYLENMVKKLQDNLIKVILVGLYKINKVKSGIVYSGDKKLVSLQNAVYKQYDNYIKELALKNNVIFFDLWNKLDNYEKIKNCIQNDGFHLKAEGYKLIADNLCSIILKNCFFK